MKIKMRNTEDLEDMLGALVEVRKKIVAGIAPFDAAPEDIRENLTCVSTAEVNLLTWVLGMHDDENDFLELAVCHDCGGLGDWYTEDSERVECACGAGHTFNEAEAN